MTAAQLILKKYGAVRGRYFLNNLPENFEYWSPEKKVVMNLTDLNKGLEDSDVIKLWVHIPELKKLVEAHERVLVWRMPPCWLDSCDGDEFGIVGAGMLLNTFPEDMSELDRNQLIQDINDVKACQEIGEHEPSKKDI